MVRVSSALLAVLCVAAQAGAQETDRPPAVTGPPSERFGWLRSPYQERKVSAVDPSNTPRIYGLMRAGSIYLSLADAIALAIENNLSVQSARYSFAIAGTDTLRAKGGGTLRGVGIVAFDLPQGVGGPASPLINGSATGAPPATSVPTDIFNLGYLQGTSTSLSPDASLLTVPLPSAAGPTIPQFDPIFTGSLMWERQQTPENSTLATGSSLLTTRSWVTNLGLQQGFSTGTSYSLTYNTTSENSNSTRNGYNPSTSGSLGITVTQPLLRGFGVNMNRRWIRIAKNDEKINDLVFRQDLINLAYGVSVLYYDLASLDEDLRVKRETLASAQELLKNTQAGVEEGTLAAVELTRARAQTAGAEQDVINAEGLVRQQEALFKNVLTRKGSREPALQAAAIVVTDTLNVPQQDPALELPELLQQAEKLRPDLSAVRLEITNTDIALEGSRNALLPQLDLVGTVQNQSLAGQMMTQSQSGTGATGATGSTGVTSPSPTYNGGYGASLDQLVSSRYPTYELGIQLTLPLRNRVAQADLTRDLLQKKSFQTQMIAIQNQAALEIDSAMIALRRARSAYEAAVRTRVLQQQSLDVEKARYEAGVDTAFFVIQYQAYVSQALSTEVVAKGDYFKAVAGLGRAVGTLLDTNHISVDEARQGKVSAAPARPPQK